MRFVVAGCDRSADANPGEAPDSAALGGGQYRTTVALGSPADDGAAQTTFLRWLWYAARREGLHLDEAEDVFSTPERVAEALRAVVAPALRLTDDDQRALESYATVVRYGRDEALQRATRCRPR